MPIVSFDDRSFLVDGNRIWLMSGSVHYFRTPAALWRDRLLKAKRAGLNCIDTYVAWNLHEPQEGKWDFTGDKDIVAFIRLCGELGLYVILRPGPYICAEWDFGGLPAWLTTKGGIAYRTNNAAYTHYYDKFFRQLLPRLADFQVIHGGPIILIQNENEYFMTTQPERLAYLEFINQLFRRSGFEIPIINCNMMTDPPVGDNIECANGYDGMVQQLKRLRTRQPAAPMLVTEYWDGWFDYWGAPRHETRPPQECARRAMEILGCGAQINYYMWHGGTNFAFWGSRLVAGDSSYQTTSYDYDAPLAEGGGLTPKYYLTRLVNLLASGMGRYLAATALADVGATITDTASVTNLTGPNGRWSFITNNGHNDIKAVSLSLPSGHDLRVSLEPIGAAAVPFALKLTDDITLDYTNLMPLGFHRQKVLVLHGPAGWAGKVSINGRLHEVEVPAGAEPTIVEDAKLWVAVINSDLAMRTFLADDMLLFGADFVGATNDDVVWPAKLKQMAVIMLEELKLTHRKAPAQHAHTDKSAPKLAPWTLAQVCLEPLDSQLKWQAIDKPRDVDQLGQHYGYLWHRIVFQESSAAKRHLYLPQCADRATISLNKHYLGTWGRGHGATTEPIPAAMVKGDNELVILIDNMGRTNFGPGLGEIKGLYGHIYDARPVKGVKYKLKKLDTFPKRLVPRRLLHMMPYLERTPVHSATVELPLKPVRPLHLSYVDLPCTVAVLCNDHLAAFIPHMGNGFGEVMLATELKPGKNKLELLLWGAVTPASLEKIQIFSMDENLTAGGKWSWRPWTLPATDEKVLPKRPYNPAWFKTTFKHAPSGQPLFVRIATAGKGQIFLNKHNVGRYWRIGPQQHYYLPECWLAEQNELMIFDETGTAPTNTTLEHRPLGPFQEQK